MLKWYQGVLAKRPVFVQSVTTALLFGAGDILAQQAVEKKGLKKHEWARTGRMVFYGGTIFGPAATLWYRLLASKVNLSSKKGTMVARVAADQVVFTPINLVCFLSTMAFLEGWPKPDPKSDSIKSVQSISDIKAEARALHLEAQAELALAENGAKERISEKLQSTYWTALSRNWLVWPAVQAVNFSIVPLEHRVLVVNVVALGWNCYLSYLNSAGGKDNEGEKGDEKKL